MQTNLKTLPDSMLENAAEACGFLKSLTHETRLLILCNLMEREYSVTELEETLGLRQPAVSQQLARLRADDLVNTRRDGKTVYYSLAREDVREVIGLLYEMFCKR